MSSDSKGRLVVISGPSGVGKSTICDEMNKLPGFRRVVTCTTRQPRPREIEGKDYYFLTQEEFERGIRRGRFLEHAVVHGHHYGTPREDVEETIARGDDALLAIDVQGAEQLRLHAASAERNRLGGKLTTIFLLPPDEATLAVRLKRRGTEDSSKVATRLETARLELEAKGKYDRVVVNNDLSEAVEEIVRYLRGLSR